MDHIRKTREYAMKTSEMAALSNFRWQSRKEHPNQTTKNGDRVEKARRQVSE